MFFFCCASKEDDDEDRAKAATKIQAAQRGKIARRKAEEYKANAVPDVVEDLASEGGGAGAQADAPAKLLKVVIKGAKNLRNVVRGVSYRAKSSPFVKCDVGGVKFETPIVKRNLNPTWDEVFECVDVAETTPIQFEVFHPAVGKTKEISLGTCSLEPEQFKDGCDTTINLIDPGNKNAKKLATLIVKVDWVTATPKSGRISAFGENKINELWIVRYKSIGLRSGPGVHEHRVNIDLKPGEQFEVVEKVEGAEGQVYLRLKDNRGWAFSKSPKSGEVLCEEVEVEQTIVEEEGDAEAAGGDEEGAPFEEATAGEPEAEEAAGQEEGGENA